MKETEVWPKPPVVGRLAKKTLTNLKKSITPPLRRDSVSALLIGFVGTTTLTNATPLEATQARQQIAQKQRSKMSRQDRESIAKTSHYASQHST